MPVPLPLPLPAYDIINDEVRRYLPDFERDRWSFIINESDIDIQPLSG
jgi:hypothetical protein